MSTLLQFEDWLTGYQSRPARDMEEFNLEVEARLQELPVEDRPRAEALRQQVLAIADGEHPVRELVPPPDGPPEEPPEEAPPVKPEPQAPPKPKDRPIDYEDLLLVTTVLYMEGRILSRGEVMLGCETLPVRCRHYQLVVRRYTKEDGSAFLDLLRSNDPLVTPHLWAKVPAPVRKLSPVSCIIDTPVRRAGGRLPFVIAGPSAPQNGGTVVMWGDHKAFANFSQAALHLFEESEHFEPTLTQEVPEALGRKSDGFDLRCARHGRAAHFQWDPQRVCYLEPEWPENGASLSLGLLETRMDEHAREKCGWLGSRGLAERNFEAPADTAWNRSILASPEGAQAARHVGCRLHGELLPLMWEDTYPMLDVNGEPLKTRPDQWESVHGERLQVQENLLDRWFQIRATESMGRLLRDSR